jgi:hypothetical protein
MIVQRNNSINALGADACVEGIMGSPLARAILKQDSETNLANRKKY